jgi:hypothetical protein
MGRPLAGLVTGVVGASAGAVSHTLGSTDPRLTAAVAVSYALTTALALRHPDVVYERDVPVWAVGRWSGASTAFVLAVALLGVGPTLPVSGDLRFSLQLLVLGVGFAMWIFGVAYARAKAA